MQQKRKYNVIFRACDVVNAVNNNPRPFNLSKNQLIKVCFLSLLDALRGVDYIIIVLGDKLSEDMVNFFESQKVDLRLGNFGNDASIRETIKIANTLPDDEWIYFCEDDFLHVADCFQKLDKLIEAFNSIFPLNITFDTLHTKNKLYYALKWAKLFFNDNFRSLSFTSFYGKKDLVIFLPDYPDRYIPKYRRHSLIVQTKDHHWRQVQSVTFTFLMQSAAVKKHYDLFMKASNKANDKMLSNKLFGNYGLFAPAVAFSPMPGLSTHMHRDTMTELVDWETIVKKYLEKI